MNNPKQVVFKLEEMVERIAPSNSQLRASVIRFPAPQEWLDEEERIFVGKPEDFPSNAEVDAYYRERLEIGEAYKDDPREILLRELAAEYHERVAAFDAMIAPKGEPRSGGERRAMQLHALGVQDQLEKRIPSYERSSFRYYIAEGAK